MIVTCMNCGMRYDDFDHWTFCPHDYFEPNPFALELIGEVVDKPNRKRPIIILPAILIALFAVLIIMAVTLVAKSEELSEIDQRSAAYCALYSREMVFIEIVNEKVIIGADTDVILQRAKGHYGECISILPTLLPLPQGTGSLRSWMADMRDLIILRASSEGVVPATEKPNVENTDDQSWRDQCRAEYNTWDEDTGTVIRRGNPERVRCPCGGDVQCVPG